MKPERRQVDIWIEVTTPVTLILSWISEKGNLCLKLYFILDFSRWYTIANTRFRSNQSICKVWSCYVQWFRRRCIYKKVHYFTFDLDLRSKTNTKCCPVSATSYDLCTCKVWSCYVQRLRRICIYKKYLIWPWPWVKVTQSIALYIMCPMCLQSLKLLRSMVKEMHLQENILFDLDPKVKVVKVTQNVAQYSQHHDLCTSKDWCRYNSRLRRRYNYKKIHYLTLTLYPYIFTRKCIIWPLGQGHIKCCPVPSTLCDLFSYKVWRCYV